MSNKRQLKYGIAIIAGLVVIQVFTYKTLAYKAMPKTVAHFLPRAAFVCVPKENWDSFSQEHQQALDAELRKHYQSVYHAVEEIPETRARYFEDDGERVLVSLEDGAILHWETRQKGTFWFSASYSDHEGPRAAEGRDAIFVWVLFGWVHLFSHNYWVA